MIKKLSLFLLAGCMSNQTLSTMSMAQENIWNLSRICLGMDPCQVRCIMHDPYKTQCFTHDGKTYWIWFYVTKPAALDQKCLLKRNVIPLVFEEGVLIGWGFDVYDCMLRKRVQYSDSEQSPKDPINSAIQELETTMLTENQVVEGGECDCPICKPRRPPLDEEDDRMVEEANDQNFNFW